ncbi:MAG TPA: preprotein translocase subunit SecG [Candidatus Polarisedimenticolaceae bacterium]|nr:preprotein translocase subunit SecG [Candidatus Polarisedimenticolaceae bacterium]
MKSLFNYITVISAVTIITTVLLQSRGSSLGASFGGGDSEGFRTRRGAERGIYLTTVGAGFIFVLSVLLSILSK